MSQAAVEEGLAVVKTLDEEVLLELNQSTVMSMSEKFLKIVWRIQVVVV